MRTMRNFILLFAVLLAPGKIFSQVAGDNCSNATSITPPWCGTNQATCGFTNDLNGPLNCFSLPSQYTDGPDHFYTFTASTNGPINIQMSNTSYYGTIAVFQGCPNSMTNPTNCIAAGQQSNLVTFTVTAGQTYYIVIDGELSPNCYTYDLCVSPPPSAILQPPCTNLGFESGLTGWFGTTGAVKIGTTGATAPTYTAYNLNTYGNQISIVTAGTDSFGQFPTVFAGAQSVRIGDGTGSSALGASLEQYFQVTPNNTNFTYNYAAVLEDGGHANIEQPFFQVEVFDQNGNPITCGNYLVTAPGTGWTISNTSVFGVYDVLYKPWTSVSINLLPYVGQNIHVRFTAGDCAQGGHFGYVYIDCSCAPYTIDPDSICQGETATLTAPAGAQSYAWSPGGQTTQVINVNPTSTTVYTCVITSFGITPCVGTYTTQVVVSASPTITATGSATLCPGGTGTLSVNGATSYSWTPSTGLSSSTGSVVTANPGATTTYSAIGTTNNCSDTATAQITISPAPTITVNNPSFCVGDSAALNATGATTYTWSPATGLSSTTGSTITATPSVTTTYTITGTASTCTSSATAVVTINLPPVVTVNSASICPGASTTLNAGGANTYSWSPPTGLSSTSGASVTANPTVTTTYMVIGTSAAGCTDTAVATVTISGNLSPTVNSASVCNGSSASLNANGATSYTWSPAIGLNTTTGASVTANPSVTTTYTITAASGSCTGTVTAVVTVNPLPTVTVNSGTVCAGQSTTLTANGAQNYTWSPATGLSSTSGSSVTANPSSSSVYTVTGSDANGCANTSTCSVTMNPLPQINVNSALVCGGGSATLNASGASTYSWGPATGLTTTSGAVVNASPLSTTVYTVNATDVNGCTGSAISTVVVVVNPTITINPAIICAGNSATLNASGATNYSWAPATGLNVATGSSVTASPQASITYTVTGTIGTCTAVATTTVTINPLPVIAIGSNGPVCVNQTLNLNASGGQNYSWSGPNSFSSSQQNPSIPGVAQNAGGNYSVQVMDGNSCVNTATVNVVINPLPVVSANGATVCVGNTINLTAGGGVSYSWMGPNNYSSNQQNPAISNADQVMNGNYIVTVTDLNGCMNANAATVLVNSLPVIMASANGPLCAGAVLNLSATGATNYQWNGPAGFSSAQQNPTVNNVQVNSSGNYFVTASDANGCIGSDAVNVIVNPSPIITVNSGAVCAGNSILITANGATTYSWSNGANGNSIIVSPGNTSTYTVTGNANGCTNTAASTVVVYPVPYADFNYDPQPASVLNPHINFYNTSGGANIVTWNWNFGNTSSTVQNPSYMYPGAGSYAVQLIVTSDHGCKDSIIKTVVINEEFSIYVPNAFSPNGDGTNDAFGAKGEGIKEFKMYIFDRWGNQAFYSEDINTTWDGTVTRKGEMVQEDVYVWKIEVKGVGNIKKELSGTVSLLK